jgi:hypothetical protein
MTVYVDDDGNIHVDDHQYVSNARSEDADIASLKVGNYYGKKQGSGGFRIFSYIVSCARNKKNDGIPLHVFEVVPFYENIYYPAYKIHVIKKLSNDEIQDFLAKEVAVLDLNIPQHLITPTIFESYIQKHRYPVLRDIPDIFKTPEICSRIVKRHPFEIRYVPDEFLSTEMCMEVVQEKMKDTLMHIPRKYINKEMCLHVLKTDPASFPYIPFVLRDEDVCLCAFQNGVSIRKLPKDKLVEAMYLPSVQRDGHTLKCIPHNMRTLEVCVAALKQNKAAIKYVPKVVKCEMMK